MKKTLYLDFDGVLHPMHRASFDPFCQLAPLEELLVGRPVEIVVSSTWRLNHSLADLRSMLRSLGPQVVETTGVTVLGAYARHAEILEHARWTSRLDWRALDDSRYEFPEDEERLIWCDPRVGVDQQQLAQIEAWLEQPYP